LLSVNGERLLPEKQYFDNFPQQPSTKVGLRSTPFEDLYVVLEDWNGDGPTAQVGVAVFVNPLVSWIWAGGVLLLFGTLITLWPTPVTSRQRASVTVPRGAVIVSP
jgi:cytochrome c-type biogenesis protein CcmF